MSVDQTAPSHNAEPPLPRDRALRLLTSKRPLIMGILNVTPDSFSDGGQHYESQSALVAARQMIADGADIIDIGGESTRPGAAEVSINEELQRVIPIIEALSDTAVTVSIDTSKPAVMRAAVAAGAGMINDVRALQEPGALDAALACDVPVCLMHMQGQPRTMQDAPQYHDVVGEVTDFLRQRADICCAAGLDPALLVLDPGFGFGKSTEHNLCLLKELRTLVALNYPVLIGLSRKSLFGTILGTAVDDRVYASVAAALMAVERGATIVRVHDVRETAHALGIYNAVEQGFIVDHAKTQI